jgi:hypothetical protein
VVGAGGGFDPSNPHQEMGRPPNAEDPVPLASISSLARGLRVRPLLSLSCVRSHHAGPLVSSMWIQDSSAQTLLHPPPVSHAAVRLEGVEGVSREMKMFVALWVMFLFGFALGVIECWLA